MSKLSHLIAECESHNLNVSVTYQRINNCSVEIYQGYKETYRLVYYTDAHLTSKKAIKEARKFMKFYKTNYA